MTDSASLPPEKPTRPPAVPPVGGPPAYAPPPAYQAPVNEGSAVRLPFSKVAIAGFVISCVSIFVFGIIGVLGVALSARGFRATRQGVARGRGLAIAGIIIGTIGFILYAASFLLRVTS